MTIVMSSFFAGAEMMTLRAPASRWARAFVASVKCPVDSMTTSAPSSFHGSADGSRSARTRNEAPPTVMLSSPVTTSCWSRPRIESYLSRCASVLMSVRSLTPTTSTSAPDVSRAR
jgi:hypothetical protein